MGILGIVAMPFGLDAECWRQMGYGIEWMNAVGLWVASLPGAFGRVTLFSNGALLLMTAGLLVIGLLKTPLRWVGFVPVALAIFWAAGKPLRAASQSVAPTAGSRSIIAAAIASRFANGSPPMPTAAMFMIGGWGRGLPAISPAASASSPTARSWLTCSRPTRMRKTAGVRLSLSPRAAIRRRIAGPKSFRASYGASAARWRCAANKAQTGSILPSIQRGRRISIARGHQLRRGAKRRRRQSLPRPAQKAASRRAARRHAAPGRHRS
jgi:hypothetical protein